MGFYIGSKKVKLIVDGTSSAINFFSSIPIISGVVLLSSDEETLTDVNNLVLTTEEEI